MHWVDRSPEPDGLGAVRSRYILRWVEYYPNRTGVRPSDSHWRRFHDDLSKVFSGLCAYCEESDEGEVDHFHPKSKFPQMVYDWSNWVFACHSCNLAKGEKWPPGGYVDPCSRSRPARPENFFDFNTVTGYIIPKAGLSPARRKKAMQMIGDLRLNAHHHLRTRRAWVRAVSESLSDDLDINNPSERDFLDFVTD